MKKYCLPLVAAFLVLAGCKSDNIDPEPVINGSDYFPLAPGDYSIYEVSEINQIGDTSNAQAQIDSVKYQLREVVDSAFTDLQNEEFYRIFRYRRSNANDAWQEDSVLVAKKTAVRLEWVEHNQRVVKLVFPMQPGRSWNLNMLNSNPEKRVSYKQVDAPYTLKRSSGDTLFAQTAFVVSALDSTGIQAIKTTERYAKNTGLIERVYQNVYYDDFNIGSGEIKQATYKTVKLLQRGKEQ